MKLDDAGIRTREVLTPKKVNDTLAFRTCDIAGDLDAAIIEGLKKLGIVITEENRSSWTNQITIVDPGGFDLYCHMFYVYLNKKWKFTIKRKLITIDGNLACTHIISNEEPPEGITL